MRLLFITLEFSSGAFSGNGIYAQSQVRALRAQGHQVLVLCGCPAALQDTVETTGGQLEVSLPVWGRLDEQCSWREFAEGAATDGIASAVAAFLPDAVLGVDWHSLGAWQRLQHTDSLSSILAVVPYIYLNYRVYSRTASGTALELLRWLEQEAVSMAAAVVCLSRSDVDHIRQHLLDSSAPSHPEVHVLLPALRADVEALAPPPDVAAALQHSTGPSGTAVTGSAANSQSLAAAQPSCNNANSANGAHQPQRRYLTCCVRLSPEKEPHRFVAAVEVLAKQKASFVSAAQAAPAATEAAAAAHSSCMNGSSQHETATQPDTQQAGATASFALPVCSPGDGAASSLPANGAADVQPVSRLQRLGIVPLLCGAADSDYAAGLRARLLAVAPDAVIERRFLSPAQLAEVYAATKLNVHPCTYDAYGMTVVEAASQGAPSLVMSGDAVGATDLLSGVAGECFQADMGQPAKQLADEIEQLLGDEAALAAVGARAAVKARTWTEAANAAQLMEIVDAVLAHKRI